eukprot:1161387-Pelagomonas_calceolata.AAC.11
MAATGKSTRMGVIGVFGHGFYKTCLASSSRAGQAGLRISVHKLHSNDAKAKCTALSQRSPEGDAACKDDSVFE